MNQFIKSLSQEEKEKGIKEFLFEIDCLEKIENQTQGFNVFDVLKCARNEIRHSNVMAWLFDPHANHGMSESVLKKLIYKIVKSENVENETAFKLLTLEYDKFEIYREWQNIDIIVKSDDQKIIICIENKIDTNDHDGQLNRYYKIIDENFPAYNKVFFYLTPDGRQPIDDEYNEWRSVSYQMIVDIIEENITSMTISEEVRVFIEDYLSIIRREIMDNEKLNKLCQKIYNEHKIALDLIYENRPDRLQAVSSVFTEWCKRKEKQGELKFDEKSSTKSIKHFTTQALEDVLLSSNNKSWWGTRMHWFYELICYYDNKGNIKYKIQFVFNTTNLEDKNREQFEKINSLFTEKKMNPDWQWRTVFKSKNPVTIKESDEIKEFDEDEMDSTKEIFGKLDKLFDEAIRQQKIIIDGLKQEE